MAFMSEIANKVAFVNYFHLLTKATADTEEPTPGYLYKEITDVALSSPSNCTQVLDFLFSRLEKPSCRIKLKVLKVLFHVHQGSPQQVRAALRLRDAGIKAAANFAGPPDPLRGMVPYEAVQKAANDLLLALFDPESMERELEGGQTIPGRPFQGGMGSSSGNRGKYEGFGSSPINREGTVTDKVVDLLEHMLSSEDSKNDAVRQVLETPVGMYEPVRVAPMEEDGPGASPGAAVAQPIRQHVAGRPGGGWDWADGSPGAYQPQLDLSASSVSTDSLDQSAANGDDSQERQLVDAFCPQDCTVPVPRSELQEMCKRCSELNMCSILQHLKSKLLVSNEVAVQIKALLLLEWFLRWSLVTPEALGAAHGDYLRSLAHAEDPTVCVKATKILLIAEMMQTANNG